MEPRRYLQNIALLIIICLFFVFPIEVTLILDHQHVHLGFVRFLLT